MSEKLVGSKQHRPCAVVSGASRGIGRAISLALLQAGWDVIGVARSVEQLERIQTEAPARTMFEPATVDLRNLEELEAFWASLGRRGIEVSAMVNNAAVAPIFKRAEEVTFDDWQRIMDINLRATFACSVRAYQNMRTFGRQGSIVNIASMDAHVGMTHMSAYVASKFGVVGLTRALAVEWAPMGIRVNSVSPGPIATDMTAGIRANKSLTESLLSRTPMARFADPSEVAGAVVFLLSPQASFITGADIAVDGGYVAS